MAATPRISTDASGRSAPPSERSTTYGSSTATSASKSPWRGGGEERVVAPVGHTGTVHLAQLNVGRLRAPIDDPRTGEFVANLEPINVLAEASPGYVWRLKDASGAATHIRAFEDELMIVNLTVWTSIEALADFVFRTGHVEFLRRRREWFESAGEPTTCLWWIPEGKFPSVPDAIERLDHLRAHGPTPASFTFRTRFDPGGGQPSRAPSATPAPHEGSVVGRAATDTHQSWSMRISNPMPTTRVMAMLRVRQATNAATAPAQRRPWNRSMWPSGRSSAGATSEASAAGGI